MTTGRVALVEAIGCSFTDVSVPLPNTAERSLGHGEGRSVRLIYVALIAVTIPLGLALPQLLVGAATR